MNGIYFKTIIVVWLLATMASAGPLPIQKLGDCNTLSASIRSNTFQNNYQNPIDSVRKRYALVKKFSVGKGGAYVAIVKDTQDANKEKIIKIFPSIAVASNKYNYRELFYSCVNSFISYKQLGINIDGVPESMGAFPQLFELGVTSSATLDGSGSTLVYPYMISEYIKGDSLTGLGVRANEKKNDASFIASANYNIYNKDQKISGSDSALLMNKQRTQAVLYQIAHILYKIKRLNISGKEYGFYHADLNSGNVMVRTRTFSGSFDAGFGAIKVKHIPLVTFIDFGHSTSDLDDALGSEVKSIKTFYHTTVHFMSGSLEEFYKNLNNKTIGKLTEAAIAATTIDTDIRFYRVIARALFDSNNYINKPLMLHLDSCTTRTSCVEKAPALFAAP